MQYQFIQNNCSEFTVKEMCVSLELKRSGYYDWLSQVPSARDIEDKVLRERIGELREQARGRYGHRPIHHHLREESLSCGRDRVLRLMQELGIVGKQRKGHCYDNAAQESFCGRYKTASVRNHTFASKEEAQSHVFEYIEIFYNRFRKHSSLGYKSPIEFEQNFCSHGGNYTSLPACLSNN